MQRVLRMDVAKAMAKVALSSWPCATARSMTCTRIEASMPHLSRSEGDLLCGKGRAFCSTANANPPPNNQAPAQPQTSIPTPPPPPPPPSYAGMTASRKLYCKYYNKMNVNVFLPYNSLPLVLSFQECIAQSTCKCVKQVLPAQCLSYCSHVICGHVGVFLQSTDYSSSYQQSTVRRRPYNLEAKMRMKQYRREAMHRQQALEIEEEERNFQLDQSKLYQKGDPGTVQGIVKDIITVGYFMSLPDGREGFLPCMQLGCTGGIPLLTRLFKVGDEITVRQQKMYDGGKDKLFARKDSA